jgi:hypothetical protein
MRPQPLLGQAEECERELVGGGAGGGHGVWSLTSRSFRAAHTLQMSWPTARNFAPYLGQVAHPDGECVLWPLVAASD